ncbi:MAG: MFS transporter [Microbacterium sp.]|uniref:MFS transporter n=1 Tax=Microbacterium sp. TaxID=51671 RepID=UPI0026017E81|nr:MFS transporter [Microbacterium sp.]MCX6500977.1 MFS transporter [Microbacterium sp.]
MLLTTIVMVCMAGSTLPSPFYPEWERLLHLGTAAVAMMFAVHALTLLLVFLTTGSLSDYVGRRPVLTIALLLLAGALVLFALAPSLPVLVLARVIQGVAVGLALTTTGAYIAEMQPTGSSSISALINAASPTLGLAVGALWAGVALDASRDASLITFGLSAVIAVGLAAAVWALPETSPRAHGAWRSLVPNVRVPHAARSTLLRTIPAIAAAWMTGGLFISLGSTVVRDVFHESGHVLQSLTVAVLTAVGAVSVVVMSRVTAPAAYLSGAVTLVVGTLAGLVAVSVGSLLAYLCAAAITGWGFGGAYAGALRLIVPLVAPSAQAGLYAAIYLAAYLSFGAPAVVAGIVAPFLGLGATTIAYSGLVIVAAAVALVVRPRQGVRSVPAGASTMPAVE